MLEIEQMITDLGYEVAGKVETGPEGTTFRIRLLIQRTQKNE